MKRVGQYGNLKFCRLERKWIYTSQILWDTMKVILRGKFIGLSGYMKNWRNNIPATSQHPRALEQQQQSKIKEQIAPKNSRWQEIVNRRMEADKIETSNQK